MSRWTEDQLSAVGHAAELHISTRRSDGTMRSSVPIWVVRVGDDLYVRSYKGAGGTWFRRVTALGTARVSAAHVDTDVTVRVTGTADRAEIDRAYRVKYARYGSAYVEPMTGDSAAQTTLQLTPAN